MNSTIHLADEIIMIQENPAIGSPVSVLYFERYNDFDSLNDSIISKKDDIQCIVSSKSIVSKDNIIDIVKFGYTQRPELWDYADNVDTLSFLFSLKS